MKTRAFLFGETTVMSVARLIDFFSTFRVLPVEVTDVRDQIVEAHSMPYDVEFLPVDVDPQIIEGIHYRFVERDEDGNVRERILIIFSQHLPESRRRIVCCKELIHILDGHLMKTSTPRAVENLATALIQKVSSAPTGVSDIQAGKDKIAYFQALAVLVPEEFREEIFALHMAGKRTLEEVAEFFGIPRNDADMVMTDDWPRIREMLKGH